MINFNECFISLASGLVIFIIISAYKRSKDEKINKSECLKISCLVSSIVFAIISLYSKPLEPILSEPFEQ